MGALARRLHERGAEVTVFTSTAPPSSNQSVPAEPFRVRRAPVLRDRAGYLRGYLQYMSFDIPAFFRVLFTRRLDAIIVEPPPTTGVFMRIAAALRRVPYLFYAADVWSEAAAVAGSPAMVVRAVRAFERFTYAGARSVLAVSESVADRVKEVCPAADVAIVGNGFDADVFRPYGERVERDAPYLLYAGTASEVHGARIFIDALPAVVAHIPEARVVFIGQGADRDAIAKAAAALAPGTVEFLPRLGAEETSAWIRGANATLASMRPAGYDAFPTKMYASVGCGTPVIYAGDGAGRAFAAQPDVGWAVDYDAGVLAQAMVQALQRVPAMDDAVRLANWARERYSLNAVAERISDEIGRAIDAGVVDPHPHERRDTP